MSDKGRYCWIENDGKYKCDHLKQQLSEARREGWEQAKEQVDTVLEDTAWKFNRLTVKDFRDAIAAMAYKEGV